MAKIPVAENLGEVQVGNVRSIVQPNAAAFGAVGQAMQGLAKVGADFGERVAHDRNKSADYEQAKRFVEFDLELDRHFDEAQRSAPANPAGFSSGFRQTYDERAREFFKSVPPNLRGKYDEMLSRRGAQLESKARDWENRASDEYHVTDLSQGLSGLSTRAATKPETYQEDVARGYSIIDAAPISALAKMKLKQKFAQDAEGIAIRARIERGDDLDQIMTDLRGGPEPLDTDENPEARAKPFEGTAPAPRKRISSFAPAVNSAIEAAAEAEGVSADDMAVFARIESSGRPDAVTGSYRGLFQLSKSEFKKYGGGDIFNPADNARAQARKMKAEAAEFQAKYGKAPTPLDLYLVHQQGEGGYAAHVARPDAPAWQNMASTGEGRQKGARWSKQAIWGNVPDDMKARFGRVENVTSQQFMNVWKEKMGRMGGGSGEIDAGPTYSGPFRHLSADQRLDLMNTARAAQKREAAMVMEDVRSFNTIAEKGFAPPADQLAAIRGRVEKVRDPEVKQAFREAEAIAQWQGAARAFTPQQLDTYIRQETDRIQAGGASPFDVKRLEIADKLLGNMRSELKSDALGWADRVGLVKVAPIDFSSPDVAQASLATRVQQGDAVAAKYGVAPKYLRPDEEQRLSAVMDAGGDQMLSAATMIAVAAKDKTPAILSQVFKQSPTAAILGGLAADIGVTSATRDAAEGLALSKQEDFKSFAPPAKEARNQMAGVLGAALSGMPKTESAIVDAANKIYEVRVRKLGLTGSGAEVWLKSQEVWKQGLKEVVGERDIDGKKYGGVVDADPSYFGGRNIIIPPFLSQDNWRDAVDMIQPMDLETAGLGTPAGGDGKPISLARVKGATLVQTGDGRYAFSMGNPDVPGEEKWVVRQDNPGELFEVDLRQLRPDLSRRRPDLFFGSFDTDENPEARARR